MTAEETLEKRLEKLAQAISPDEALVENVMSRIDTKSIGESERIEKLSTKFIARRFIMNPFTKLAAAAVIIAAVVLSINFWSKTIPTAYAFEQTVEANHSVRYIHIKETASGHEDEPREFWLEFYEDGQVKNMRIHMPAWDYPQDGAKVTVWKENIGQVWLKKKNALVTVRDKTFADRMLKLVEAFDPRLVVERLYKQEVEGKVKIEIDEPSNKAEPIVVTATSPHRRSVLLVDRATKLVTAIKSYQFKDGEYQYLALLELDNYNQPMEADVFTLGEVPDDVLRIDQTAQEVGLAQGNLTDESVAVEVVRKFFEALIAEDYTRAGQLYEGMPADKMQQMFGHIRVLRIISIGPAGPHPVPSTKGLNVPCTVEIEKDGKRSQWKPDLIGVREVYNQPGRWTIFGSENQGFEIPQLRGEAEDLWGNRYKLLEFRRGVVLIHPFSPANCGYCLGDGEFVRENYFRNNEEAGGSNFLQCLFNPQLDIYTFQKHYRETSIPVLTFPATLHDYHGNGFPFLIAFQDGKLVHRVVLSPYEETFRRLRTQLWPAGNVPLTPTSPLYMATRFVAENRSELAVEIYADTDKARVRNAKERLKKRQERSGTVSTLVRHEGQLSGDDYEKNLYVKGITEQFNFGFLKSGRTPINFTTDSIQIGDYKFPKSEVGVAACFPNPYNTERYVCFDLRGSNVKTRTHSGDYVDYVIYRDGADKEPEILLHGFFNKDNDDWRFSSALAYGTAVNKRPYCQESICSIPSEFSKGHDKYKHKIRVSPWLVTPEGTMRILGASSCRFPSTTVDKSGVCWVAWEENGDILLASVNHPEAQVTVAVENDLSDSFNPMIAHDGSMLWIFYLNNRDKFYRLYARYLDGSRLSDEVLITEREPFDVITPAVASNQGGKIVVAWSEWKANFRYLRFRTIGNRSLGNIKDVAIKKAHAVYVNAWYPSLAMDKKGRPWGAWNQHYPSILGVCAGNLVDEAHSVTRLGETVHTGQNGGYPSIVIDRQGERWVFWESFAWDTVLKKIPQRILVSRYDEGKKQWSLPYTLSDDTQTTLNQTPRAAVASNGIIWTVWSGRENDINKPWGIYVAHFVNGKWSIPDLISKEGINARAPDISIGKDDKIWVAWHSGTGEQMRVQVLEYSPETGELEYLPSAQVVRKPTQRGAQRKLDESRCENKKSEPVSPKDAACAFFQACSERNWEDVQKFCPFPVSRGLKLQLGGSTVVSIGEPSKHSRGWFVPYEVKLQSGRILKRKLNLRVGPDGRFAVGGGI